MFRLFLPLALAASLLAQTPPATPKAKASPAKAPKAATGAPAKVKAATPAKPAEATPAPAPVATPAPPVAESPGDAVVLTVGTEKVTAKEFDAMIDSLPENVRAQARGPMKRSLAEQVIRVKLLASEARKRGLDKDPGVKIRMALQADSVLAGAAYNDMMQKVKVDEAAERKYFEDHKKEYEKVEARHILIKFKGSPVPQREGKPELSEEQALAKVQELRKRIEGGGDFAKLAKEESDDTGSAQNGGSLGTFGRGQMVGAFEEAAFALAAGQLSQPIKTQFGYHLIRVDKHETRSFEDVRPEIESKLKPDTARQQVEALRKDTPVVFEPNYFGPETPAGANVGVQVPVQVTPAPAPAATK
jgi:parvulin-like peptidyl-prolyl isomerase